TAYDGYGNIKTDYVGSVYFNSTDAHPILPFTLGSRYTFTSGASQDNGVHTFAGTGFTLKTTPSQTITVTDGSMYATSNPITVTPRSITVTSNPTGSGYIRVDGQTYVTPATFNWTVGDSHNISANSPVIITSNQSRYTYSSWSDSGSQSHTITVSLTSISTFTANFRLQYYHSVSGSALIVDSNSTVTGLAFNSTSRKLSFTVSGASETTGYANITIAKSLIGDINGIMVYLDGNLINFNSVSIGDSWLLQFTYQHSDHRVDVSLGSAPATTGSPGLGPLTPSMISMIGVISGVVLLVTLAWPLLGEAKRRFPKSAPGILRAPFLGLKLLFGETYRRSHAIFP
ncbi:hypothetical protein MUP77_22825, partial [Candidatus Bathyarchaeota archaeon]|nr:hypothetical protein [Candidatus Bathyarchaeota archaeon]